MIDRSAILVVMCAALLLLSGCGGNSASGASPGGGTPPPTTTTSGSGAAVPVLSHVAPSRVMVGVPQGTLLLTGSNFTQSSTVLFDGVPASSLFDNAGTIQLNIDVSMSLSPKTHTVQISDPHGTSNTLTYEVYSPQPGPAPFAAQPTVSDLQYGDSLAGQGTLADVDGDGRSDLIVLSTPAGSTIPQLMIRFGQADGSFSAATPTAAMLSNGTPSQVLAGDVNGDGRIDLILIYQNSYQVLLNNGLAQFTAAGSGALPGNNSGRGAVGDFNGDGRLDFAIDTGQVPPVSVLFGNGDGTFSAPTILGTANGAALRIAAVDLNNDGITDIVYETANGAGTPHQIDVLMFHPGGSSTDNIPAGLGGRAGPFAIGDFNHDHIPDIFVVNSAGVGQSFFGNADGTFKPGGAPISAADGFLFPPPFVVGDFDHDGNLDIATRLTLVGPDVILFLWGDGLGNFTGQLIPSDASFYLAVGDVNGDGIPDLLSTGAQAYPQIVMGRTDRNFPAAKIILPVARAVLSAGNVFGDGYRDILVSGTGDCTTAATGTAGSIYHILPNGAPTQRGTAPACTSVLADLDGDGIADLLGVNLNTVFVWKGDGTGQFNGPVAQIPISGSQLVEDFAFRDMDLDGHVDIVIAGAILYGKGNLQFDVVPIAATQNQRFLVGDFDGDGVPDIATTGGVLYGQRNRAFTPLTGSVPACWAAYLANPVAADLNGDGMDDLVCGTTVANLVEIYTGAGRAGFLQDQVLAIPGNSIVVNSVSVADFNGDGRPDIAVGTLGVDDVVLFSNNGKGEYQISSYAIGVSPILSITADFNKDGAPDLAFLNFGYDYKPVTATVLLHK